jgi:phospholipid transport system substrate-binding protein
MANVLYRCVAPLRVGIVAFVMTLCSTAAHAQDASNDAVDESSVQAEAIAVVERLQNALIQAAELSDVSARYAELADIVSESHDLAYIGELTVRRQWRDWTDQQRSEFLDAFTTLSVMNYATRFGRVGANSFATIGAQPDGGSRIQVRTTVARSDGTAVPLDFVLQQDDYGALRIVNVVADGVSDLALKRAEYRTVFNESGFAGLVADIQSQTRKLAAGQSN